MQNVGEVDTLSLEKYTFISFSKIFSAPLRDLIQLYSFSMLFSIFYANILVKANICQSFNKYLGVCIDITKKLISRIDLQSKSVTQYELPCVFTVRLEQIVDPVALLATDHLHGHFEPFADVDVNHFDLRGMCLFLQPM